MPAACLSHLLLQSGRCAASHRSSSVQKKNPSGTEILVQTPIQMSGNIFREIWILQHRTDQTDGSSRYKHTPRARNYPLENRLCSQKQTRVYENQHATSGDGSPRENSQRQRLKHPIAARSRKTHFKTQTHRPNVYATGISSSLLDTQADATDRPRSGAATPVGAILTRPWRDT